MFRTLQKNQNKSCPIVGVRIEVIPCVSSFTNSMPNFRSTVYRFSTDTGDTLDNPAQYVAKSYTNKFAKETSLFVNLRDKKSESKHMSLFQIICFAFKGSDFKNGAMLCAYKYIFIINLLQPIDRNKWFRLWDLRFLSDKRYLFFIAYCIFGTQHKQMYWVSKASRFWKIIFSSKSRHNIISNSPRVENKHFGNKTHVFSTSTQI